MKLKNFHIAKDTIIQKKWLASERTKIFTNYTLIEERQYPDYITNSKNGTLREKNSVKMGYKS